VCKKIRSTGPRPLNYNAPEKPNKAQAIYWKK